jgi:predicted metalloprotease with PDZ domain
VTDSELVSILGHRDIKVHEVAPNRWQVHCSCQGHRYQRVSYRVYSSAVDSAVEHVTKTAKRFRAEASKAGLSLPDALLIWNGKHRQPWDGRIV